MTAKHELSKAPKTQKSTQEVQPGKYLSQAKKQWEARDGKT